jgi:hypothetical protein
VSDINSEITQSNISSRVKTAARTGRIIITTHATRRGQERNISDQQMRNVAKYGTEVKTEPAKAPLNPNTRMRKCVAGDEIIIMASIVTIADREHVIIISTWK